MRLFLLAVMIFAPLISIPLSARAEAEAVFDGVYFGLRMGAVLPHGADDRFHSLTALGDDGEQVRITREKKQGFGINLAFGGRLDVGWPVWLRSEMAFGLQRYAVQGVERAGSGNGASRSLSLIWHNYFHPLTKQNPHQIWAGLGAGGSFANTKLPNGSGTASRGGVNFIALATVGYDYLILERSRFSSEYLRLGVSYHYMFAHGFRRELQSQFMVGITYGF